MDNMYLTFMDKEMMENENKYFQSQSILCRLDKLCKDFNDIKLMVDHEKPSVHRNKFDRVVTFADEVNNINKWAEEAKRQVETSIKGVEAKQGRKEEVTYWTKFKSNVEKVVQKVKTIHYKGKS